MKITNRITGIGTGPTYPCPTVKNAFGIPVIG